MEACHIFYPRFSLVNDNKIPFIDFGHTTLLPPEMAKHINRDVMMALCPSVRGAVISDGLD